MRITILSVEHITGDYGEYVKVTGTNDKGNEAVKNASERFRDKWDLLKEGNVVDFKMVQKNNKWQIEDITLAEAQQAISSTPTQPAKPAPPSRDSKDRSIERQVALKCATEFAVALIQAGKDIKSTEVASVAIIFDRFVSGNASLEKVKPE